jgi:hypothetical protein
VIFDAPDMMLGDVIAFDAYKLPVTYSVDPIGAPPTPTKPSGPKIDAVLITVVFRVVAMILVVLMAFVAYRLPWT